MPQVRGSQSLRFRRYGLINRISLFEKQRREKREVSGVRAESGSRFGSKRLGGDDCHSLARCSATVNTPVVFHVATIGSQDLPSAKSKLGIVIESICSRSQLRHPLLPCRSGILSPNHSFTVSSNLFRDCQRLSVSSGQANPKLSINSYSSTYKVYPRVELNRRSSEGKYCFIPIRNPALYRQAQLVSMLY